MAKLLLDVVVKNIFEGQAADEWFTERINEIIISCVNAQKLQREGSDVSKKDAVLSFTFHTGVAKPDTPVVCTIQILQGDIRWVNEYDCKKIAENVAIGLEKFFGKDKRLLVTVNDDYSGKTVFYSML